ncbi:uncharacterized protein LOC124884974 [Girardinichthys multiradiatus]|uniref:uncharacterized protein LOC124884974 n=1 Tax=Girardinichthys multiradiatus TaxID=208333 RepID=UPI001FADA3F3|nr:uncharacterized protein LOC124884974 [Girardinichthys multiradiatus]
MTLGFVLIFFLCTSTVTVQAGMSSTENYSTTTATTSGLTTTMKLVALNLMATPDYPVAAGQRVKLSCNTTNPSQTITWQRYHLQSETWENVSMGNVLILTQPQESGKYRCETHNTLNVLIVSQNHNVFIVSIPTTGENIGKAALVLSVLILIATIAGVLLLFWKRSNDDLSALNAPKKDVPAPSVVIPKVLPPKDDPDGDVYMNYTSTTQAYSDLNPANMTGDDCYSTLS